MKEFAGRLMDFTVKKYRQLLGALKEANYTFQTFEEYLKSPADRVVMLRHDVDLMPNNSLRFAKIQHEHGAKGSYYFRAVPESWDDSIIKEISNLNHEIGYHYENLTTCKGNLEKALDDFKLNLQKLRELAPVSTICMHGSPMSKYDSRDLWKDFDYRSLDLIGEPYFDVDFNEVFYLTDTGRKWDGDKVSVRDKVNSSFKQSYHSTNQIIIALRKSELPNKIMITFHPQRWNDNLFMWVKEYIMQNIKNSIKKLLFVK